LLRKKLFIKKFMTQRTCLYYRHISTTFLIQNILSKFLYSINMIKIMCCTQSLEIRFYIYSEFSDSIIHT
jgi:hypothetical protein